MARSAVLVGMMGSGKTTVGRAAAERLGWRFLDSDRQVEERTGRTVEQIWREHGEPGFRHLETEALSEALASTAREPAIVAAAGGVVLNPDNRILLKTNPPVVWLRARPETLAERVGTGSGRPLLAGDPAGALVRLSEERRPYYEDVADAVIDVDDLTPSEVVDRVVELAESHPGAEQRAPLDDEPFGVVAEDELDQADRPEDAAEGSAVGEDLSAEGDGDEGERSEDDEGPGFGGDEGDEGEEEDPFAPGPSRE